MALVALFAATTLAGCIPSVEASRTDLSIPRSFAENDGNAPSVDRNWADLFRSRELSQLVHSADENNLDIAAALSRITQAEALTASARAQLMPTVDASASAQRTATPGTISSESAPFSTSISNQFGAGLTASYTLDVWGRYRSLESAARADAEALAFDKDALAISITSSTATTYFTILAAKDRLALQRENIALASRILEAIKARVSVGTASALDIAEQESIVATQKASVPQLEQQIAQGTNQLAILLGRLPEGFNVSAKGLNALTIPTVKAGLPSALLLRRPDIAAAEANLRVADANIEAAQAAYLPSFDLTIKGGTESRALQNMLLPDAVFGSGLTSLAAPIFDGGALDANLAKQEGLRSELVATYKKTILSAFSDVENALVAIRQSRLQEELQADAAAAAKRAYAISEERLRAGTIDVVTLLTVQQNLFQTQAALIQSRLNRLQAAMALIQALGGGFMVADNAALHSRLLMNNTAQRAPIQ